MVKLDNWQTKAEKAGERRQAAKQRKERKSRTRSNKAMAQRLLSFLNEHNESLISAAASESGAVQVHIWTDYVPSYKSGESDQEVPHKASPRKMKGSRPRSNSEAAAMSVGSKKKKGRPRSLSNACDQQRQSDEESSPPLCCNNFFFGTCSAGGGRGLRRNSTESSCLYGEHVGVGGCTLGDVLQAFRRKSDVDVDAVLKASYAAVLEYHHDETSSSGRYNCGMEMVHHIPIDLRGNHSGHSDGAKASRINVSDSITRALSENNCTAGSIVYVSWNGVLVFDRYRDGMILTDRDKLSVLFGEGSRRRAVSVGNSDDGGAGDSEGVLLLHKSLVANVPGQILECILAYLPTTAAAALPHVCKPWHSEVGQDSPALWKMLIKRNNWPMPPDACKSHSDNDSIADSAVSSSRDVFRNEFISHYTAVRDLYSVYHGLALLLNSGRVHSTSDGRRVAVLSSRGLRNTPGDNHVKVRNWGPARVLVASCHECTLHLFDAVAGANSNNCRQSVCVSFAPFRPSRKRSVSLIEMDLNSNLVGCLFEVEDSSHPATWLSVIHRNDLVCASGGSGSFQLEEDVLCSYHLQQSIFDFLMKGQGIPCSMQHLCEFAISEDADGSALLHTYVNGALIACVGDHFLFEATCVLPVSRDSYDSDDSENSFPRSSVTGLFLFSVAAGEITWAEHVGENPSASFGSCLVGCHFAGTGGRDPKYESTKAVLVRQSPPATLAILVDANGRVQSERVRGDVPSRESNQEEAEGAWHRSLQHGRPAVVTSSEIVVATCFVATHDTSIRYKTVFSFYPNTDSARAGNMGRADILGECIVYCMETLRDDHIIAFCGPSERLFAALIHIPSRQELHRIPLESFSKEVARNVPAFPVALSANEHSIAVYAFGLGLIMAGHDIADVCENSVEKPGTNEEEKGRSKSKGKSPKHPSRGGKKDGFARGMRQSSS